MSARETPLPSAETPLPSATTTRRRFVPRMPTPPALVELGGMCRLLFVLPRLALRPPVDWGPEFISRFVFTIRICFVPLVISAFALSFGPVGVQASGFFSLYGAFDRLGSIYVLTVVRLFGPLAVATILAGAAGTAMCSDLGARVVRGEIDALEVLGVDSVKGLVLPRVLALSLAAVLFNIFAVIAGTLGAMLVLVQHNAELAPFFDNFFANATALELAAATRQVGAVRDDHRARLLLQGHARLGRPRRRRQGGQPVDRHRLSDDRVRRLRLHPAPAGHEPRSVAGARMITRPTTLLDEAGAATQFSWRVIKGTRTALRSYFSEVLRQTTVLTTGSVLVVVFMVLAYGLVVGVTSAYAARLIGAPSLAALGPAIGSLREMTPYAFAYMMAAKVSTGYVAEIGTMRITEEIDSLEVMGVRPIAYLCSTRILATLIFLPLVYGFAVVVGFAAAYVAIVVQIGQVSPGGYFELFWKFQSPPDLLFSAAKGTTMGIYVVLVGVYYGYRVRGGPVGVGQATARAMVVNLIGIYVIGVLLSQLFWGGDANLPVGG